MSQKLTVEMRVQRAHVQLMRSKQFCGLSGILMCGNVEVVDDVPTAATDGWNVVYGREFMASLDEKTFNWVVVHEAMHKALKQLTVWKNLFRQNARAANMAADHVINLLIEKMDPQRVVTSRPDFALYDTQYLGNDTKQVFDKIIQQAKADKQQGPGQGDPSEGEQGKGSGSFDEHTWGADHDLSEAEKEAREQAIDQAIRQGAIIAGKNGSDNARALSQLVESRIDWREQLREFVTSISSDKELSTWRKPSRRWLGQGMYMPSLYSENMGPIVVAIDASGSISEEDITLFASELVSVCEATSPERVHVVWWHHRIANVQVFNRGEYETMPSQLKPAGTGGTSPRCVIDWMENEHIDAECLLFLSDGYVDEWPTDIPMPSMWVMTTSVVAPHGVTVRI